MSKPRSRAGDKYAQIYVTEWASKVSPLLKSYGPEVACFWYYLRSGPHKTMSGIFSLPLAYIAHDMGLNSERVIEMIRILEKEGFILYDRDTQEIYVIDMIGTQVSDELKPADKRFVHVMRQLENVQSEQLFDAFVSRNPWAYGEDQVMVPPQAHAGMPPSVSASSVFQMAETDSEGPWQDQMVNEYLSGQCEEAW